MPDKRESRTRKEPVASYPETAVLSSRQVCEALGISQHWMEALVLWNPVPLSARDLRF